MAVLPALRSTSARLPTSFLLFFCTSQGGAVRAHHWEQTSPTYQMHFTVHLTVWLATAGKEVLYWNKDHSPSILRPKQTVQDSKWTQPIFKRKLEHNALFKKHRCSRRTKAWNAASGMDDSDRFALGISVVSKLCREWILHQSNFSQSPSKGYKVIHGFPATGLHLLSSKPSMTWLLIKSIPKILHISSELLVLLT